MKRSILSIILLLIVVLATSGRDRLYIENFNIVAGETLRVPVILLNDTAYTGLQTDLYLPVGLSLDSDDDEYIIDLTSRKGNSHTVASRLMEDGAIRIYVSSVSAQEFSGNNGAILTLSLSAVNNFSGEAFIKLKNSICAESIGTRHVLNDEICHVNPNEVPGIIGDVNSDGEVNIADINAVIDMILSGVSNSAGDVNGDAEVNIADINAVIDIILSN